jgi:two-component system cell cycle sensor histidine kinase/response regulator CckA
MMNITLPGKRVLVVDDDLGILDIGRLSLMQKGFIVDTAVNGLEAIQNFSNNKEDIVLILMDMYMPVMDGLSAYHEIRKISEDITIILCSGFELADKKVADLLPLDKNLLFRPKPFFVKDIPEELLFPKKEI